MRGKYNNGLGYTELASYEKPFSIFPYNQAIPENGIIQIGDDNATNTMAT